MWRRVFQTAPPPDYFTALLHLKTLAAGKRAFTCDYGDMAGCCALRNGWRDVSVTTGFEDSRSSVKRHAGRAFESLAENSDLPAHLSPPGHKFGKGRQAQVEAEEDAQPRAPALGRGAIEHPIRMLSQRPLRVGRGGVVKVVEHRVVAGGRDLENYSVAMRAAGRGRSIEVAVRGLHQTT